MFLPLAYPTSLRHEKSQQEAWSKDQQALVSVGLKQYFSLTNSELKQYQPMAHYIDAFFAVELAHIIPIHPSSEQDAIQESLPVKL